MDQTLENGLPYRSGMLQSWNKFCFTRGYIEVSISLPGPNRETQGYVSGGGVGWPRGGVWVVRY
jgi:beta-glucanase (GH16 family)